ncbi:MAG: M48 family metallopeptidase [Magnetococcales bacterium]|nr:M48 family metallopeptidase [Magnetococcales bacterium]NGZ27146.1 M48 family metallopeptidase [Magnetococcales bacterium]
MEKSLFLTTLQIGPYQVECHLLPMASRKRWAVEVRSTGQVILRAPARASKSQALALLHHHQSWLLERLHRQQAKPVVAPLGENTPILYLGEVLILKPLAGKTGQGVVEEGQLLLSAPSQNSEDIQLALTHWYRQQARGLLPQRLRHWAAQMGVTWQRLTIRGQSSRWGSCSGRGGINLNWQLIKLPWPLIDYVLVHELCHLLHLNHSPAFWAAVAGYLPDYARLRNQLRQFTLKNNGGQTAPAD